MSSAADREGDDEHGRRRLQRFPKNRAMRPGRLGAVLFNDDVGRRLRSIGSAIGERLRRRQVLTGAERCPEREARPHPDGLGAVGSVRS
jgi:hypothetical protein